MALLSADDAFWIRVQLPEGQFNALVAAARAGRIASRVMIEEVGVNWRADGGGSREDWDTKSSPKLPVTEVRFLFR